MVLGKVMGGGYHDPKKLPRDLLTEFNNATRRPGYSEASRKVLAGWKSWSAARGLYAKVKAPVTLLYGDSDWSRPDERKRTASLLPAARVITLKATGHFSAVENPEGLLRAVLQG
jgi:pimeloyl-ACP methyl ester carboxylesterase